jgi:hypothetical protein
MNQLLEDAGLLGLLLQSVQLSDNIDGLRMDVLALDVGNTHALHLDYTEPTVLALINSRAIFRVPSDKTNGHG